jgi:hypothetical protein
VVEVVTLLLSDSYLLQELHHAPTNEARDDHAHGETVVRGQPAVVLQGVAGTWHKAQGTHRTIQVIVRIYRYHGKVQKLACSTNGHLGYRCEPLMSAGAEGE